MLARHVPTAGSDESDVFEVVVDGWASCKDNDVNCHRWINFCASYPNIRKKCPLTCKQCQITPPIPTSPSLFPSLSSSSSSPSSSSSVLFTGSSYSFAPTRTTKFLNPSTPDINGTWNNRTKTGSTVSTTNATEATASCKDNDVNCHRWINFYASYPNIRKQCPLTCKQCRKYHLFFCKQANLILDEKNLFLAASEAP
ncbi:unnamed protein product [Porites lobata]|uniref:ShKT domain-containing protein n=1 Tax=Porites lobata TaxID=104759 RepID=A0ABN8MYK4_9CNID|nr:unnamed protein product [Porites lobata]